MDNGGSVVVRVYAFQRVFYNRQAQTPVDVAAPNALVHRVLEAAVYMNVLTYLREYYRHSRVLAYRHAQLVGAVYVGGDIAQHRAAQLAFLVLLRAFYALAHTLWQAEVRFNAQLRYRFCYFVTVYLSHGCPFIPLEKLRFAQFVRSCRHSSFLLFVRGFPSDYHKIGRDGETERVSREQREVRVPANRYRAYSVRRSEYFGGVYRWIMQIERGKTGGLQANVQSPQSGLCAALP